MTTEEAIKVLRDIKLGIFIDTYFDEAEKFVSKENEALEIAIEALEQQPCEDCISREAVDEYITNLLSGYLYDEERTRLEDLSAFVWELPSVQPTRPTGKWIVYDVVKFGDFVGTEKYECSECHHRVGVFISNFCPNCGAKMAESEDVE